MEVNSIHNTDIEIISLLKAGTYQGWEHLYNKYSPLMYGTILRSVNFDQAAANALLVKAFLDLKDNNFFAAIGKQSLSLCLVRHCYQVMSKNKKSAMVIANPPAYCAADFPLMQATIKDKQSLQMIAANFGMTQSLAMARLRTELKEARKKFPLTSNDHASMSYNNEGEISS